MKRTYPKSLVQRALCRYCTKHEEPGRARCGHCNGWRMPSRRLARKMSKKPHAQVEAY